MKTVVFYYHHFWGLGHFSRIYNIALELVKNFWDEYKVVILNSWEKQYFWELHEWIKILHLPPYDLDAYEIIKTRENLKVYGTRQWIYKKLFLDKSIQIITIEHFPFWRNFLNREIHEMISSFRSIDMTRRVFCSLRDVLDISALQLKNLKLFDRFLIHSDENIFNYTNVISPEFDKNAFYTWVVIAKPQWWISQKTWHIVVSIWGWQDGVSFVEDFLLKLEWTNFIGKVYISLWISYSRDVVKKLESISTKELIVQDRFSDFLQLKKSASCIVSMWGYNNTYENLYLWKQSIIYAREWDTEQQERLNKMIGCTEFFYDGKSLSSLNIQEILEKSSLKAVDINMQGAYASASFIALFWKHKYIKIRLLNACNAVCDMCWVIRRPIDKNSLESMEQTIHDFYLLGWGVVNFTWWEPTIYKWFYQLLEKVKSYGLLTSLSTNGSTFWDIFFKNIVPNQKSTVDYIDVSVDAIWVQHDIIRAYPWLFRIIIKWIPTIKRLGIFLHINVTTRNDNIDHMEKVYDFFAKLWVDSVSFSMIDTGPYHDTSALYPSYQQLDNYYRNIVPILEQKVGIKELSISPYPKNQSIETVIQGILKKHDYPKVEGETCPFISKMTEIRINENWEIAVCCETDDYENDIGNINTHRLVNIIHRRKYLQYIKRSYPNISPACISCKIVV